MLGEAVRRCETHPCAGLRVTRPVVPAIAAAWLEEAANVGGGLVWRPGQGDLWLLGGTMTMCRRALELLHGMGWAAELLDFPGDMPVLEAALADEPEAAPQAPPPNAAGMEGRAGRLAPEAGHTLATLWRMGPAGPRLLAQRWMPKLAALPAPRSVDWSGHAATLLAARLLARAERQQWPSQRKPNLPLLLDLPWMPPPETLPSPPPGEGHALVLPLAGLPDSAAWAALAAGAGWGLAWSGLTPSLAYLLDSLPGDFVFAIPGETAGWPASDRLILTGLTDRAALARAMAAGFGLCSPLGA